MIIGLFFVEYSRASKQHARHPRRRLDICTVPCDTRMLECRLVALLKTRPDDIGEGFPATLKVLDANGEHIVNQRALPIPSSGFTGEDRSWLPPMEMVFRDEGRHNFILSAGVATASVRLRSAVD